MQKSNLHQTKKHFERIHKSVEKINHQIDDVLDFVRERSVEKTNHNIATIIEDSLNSVNVPKSIKVNLGLEDIRISCDKHKMETVFANLIHNLLDSLNGEGQLGIRMNSKDGMVKIEFSDTGKGIPKDSIAHIFEPLYTTKQTGTGLGLASCKSIIEQHGGTIHAKNNADKGVTFTIILPME